MNIKTLAMASSLVSLGLLNQACAPNQAPVFNGQTNYMSVSLSQPSEATVTLDAVDPEGLDVIYSIVSQPTNGSLSGIAPNLVYTADVSGCQDNDVFQVSASDGVNTTTASINLIYGDIEVAGNQQGEILIGEQDQYSFCSKASETAHIGVSRTSGSLSLKVSLLDANQTLIEDQIWPNLVHMYEQPLNNPGLHFITIEDRDGSGTGSYDLSLQLINSGLLASTTDTDGSQISSGDTVQGNISSVADTDAYAINASADAPLHIVMGRDQASTIQPHAIIYSPDAAVEYNVQLSVLGAGRLNDFTPAQDGEYTVVVADYLYNDTGSYDLTITNLNDLTNNVELQDGVPYSTQISIAAEVNTFTFEGTAGDLVNILSERTVNNGQTIIFDVYDPDFNLIDEVGGILGVAAVNNLALASTGTYTIVAYDRIARNTGAYQMSITKQ